MIFHNQPIGRDVTVDLDVFFYYFVNGEIGDRIGTTLQTIRERIKRLTCAVNTHGAVIMRYYYRRSSNDHVHVKLTFSEDLTVLDAFMIRAWLFDDQTRLSLDLARYLITGSLHEMNRCFDEKATMRDVVKKAGPWIPLSLDVDQYQNEISEDWIKYLERFKITGQTSLSEGS